LRSAPIFGQQGSKRLAAVGGAAVRLAVAGIPETAQLGPFKREFDETIRQSGLAGGVSYLDKEDRQAALGLAVNWGMCLLIAYALECSRSDGSGRKDLAWVASVVRPLLTADSGKSASD
jgi:hypothetical protein